MSQEDESDHGPPHGHWNLCACDLCHPDEHVKSGVTECMCDDCDPEQIGDQLLADAIRSDYIAKVVAAGHHIGCDCDLCQPGVIRFHITGPCDACTCDTCYESNYSDRLQIVPRREEKRLDSVKYPEDTLIRQDEICDRIIAIWRDPEGYLYVSSLLKSDMFTGETVWVLDQKEAEIEVARFRREATQSPFGKLNFPPVIPLTKDSEPDTIPLGVVWSSYPYRITVNRPSADTWYISWGADGIVGCVSSMVVDTVREAYEIKADFIGEIIEYRAAHPELG
jgi:hypothetical protein